MSQQAARGAMRAPSLRRGPQIVAGLLLIGLLVAMATKPLMQLRAQKERLEQMGAELSKLESENAELESRIDRFQDPDFIEQKAREQAGLVLPGEILYVTMPPSEAGAEAKSRRPKEPAAEAPLEENLVQRFLEFAGLM